MGNARKEPLGVVLPRPMIGLPSTLVTLKFTTGGLAIETLVTVIVGSRAFQAATEASVAEVALLAMVIAEPEPGGPAGPVGPVGPVGPWPPVAPVAPESPPPQPDSAAASTPAAMKHAQRKRLFFSIDPLLRFEHMP